jgi:hypothetical protein
MPFNSAGYIAKAKSNNWGTPDRIMTKYKDWIDPCPFPRADWDALTIDWNDLRDDDSSPGFFVNPPYSNIGAWAKKCYQEAEATGLPVHLLIPARTDTRYFHDWILPFAEIEFIKGRLRFISLDDQSTETSNAPFPSIIAKYS